MVDPAVALLWAASISVILGLLFWPQSGYYWNIRSMRRMSVRVRIEDALKHLFDFEYRNHTATVQSLAGALEISQNAAANLVLRAESIGVLKSEGETLALTQIGRQEALRVIRIHRLWEHYLSEKTGVNEEEWHRLAEDHEHDARLDVDRWAEELGNPAFDPHGDPIPTAKGEIAPREGHPLTELEAGRPAIIVHIEDEPEAVYSQLVAEGLSPGTRLEVIQTTRARIQFWANGESHVLAPLLASNVSVVETEEEHVESGDLYESLADLQIGQSAQVAMISPQSRGLERRRLMDLGILPGTTIVAEMRSPGGDPTAYRIRGATIALRREQADLIRMKRDLENQG